MTSVGKRDCIKRDGGNGDVFDYDQADQVTVAELDVPNPNTTAPGAPTIIYDANGNRNWFEPYGPVEQYSTDEFNRYPSRTINGTKTYASYNNNSDMTAGLDESSYAYDAQNRLTSATKNAVTDTFAYDSLNRQVSRTVGAVTTYNVYDGWGLIVEYAPAGTTPSNAYLSGAGGMVKNLVTNKYYYQDASGSTSHLAGGTGALVEWYRYDLQGTPIIYDSLNHQLSTSNYGIRHLFTGQQWYSELGLYDLRNRSQVV